MDNKAVDALSRKPEGGELAYLVVPTLLDTDAISAGVYEDIKLRERIGKLYIRSTDTLVWLACWCPCSTHVEHFNTSTLGGHLSNTC